MKRAWETYRKDHPRVCGEQAARAAVRRRRYGSPPRVRGTAVQVGHICKGWGITPACAGNSQVEDHGFEVIRDHPRVCGEQAPRRL